MGRELVIYIGNIRSDDIPPFGKFIKFHKHDKFALFCAEAHALFARQKLSNAGIQCDT